VDNPTDPMKPSVTLLVKLGSIAIHADELTDDTPNAARGHKEDAATIKSLLSDPEVFAWMHKMRNMAFLPVKR
jgi:hypothetical protein